jgi:hypothetical protein
VRVNSLTERVCMRFAYADPPYLGWSRYYDHPDGAKWDKPETHRELIEQLCADYDGWAMSLHSPALRTILPMCPEDVRVMAWVKPFASFKPSVRVAYAWEPVIVRGGRKRSAETPTIRDWLACSITLRRGFTGAKPAEFAFWLFEVLGMNRDDEFADLFPGSGAVGAAWEQWRGQQRLFA